VINIVTKRPDRQPVTIRAESGSWGSRQAAAAGSVSIGDIHASGGVVYSHSGGWDFAAADELGVTRSVPMASTNAGGFLQLDYGALRSTTYVGSVVRRVMAFTRTVWDSPPEIEQRGLHLVTDLEYRFEPAPAWASAINLTFNYLYGHPGYDADSARDDVFRSTSYTTLLEWTNRLRVSETTGLLAGASMENDQGDAVQPTLTLVSGIPRPFNVFHGTNPDPLELYPDVNATHWSAFLQFEHAPFIWLSIVAGLQANKVAGADVTVVPRLSFISTWESHWNAKLMYGKAFRSPIVAERYVLVPNVLYGNDGLGPELVETVEAVFMYRGRSSEAGVTAFRSRQSDVIRSTFRGEQLPNTLNGVQTPLGVPFFVNRGTVSIQGIELEGKASVTQDLDFTGSLTYQTEEGTFPLRPGVDTTAGNTNGMPRLLLKVGCEYRGLEGCTFGLFDAFAGSTPDLPAQNFYNAPVRDVHIVSANIRFDLKEIFSLSGPSVMFNVRISNLLDEESSFANPSQRVVNTLPLYPGRQYSAGLRVTL
jgi:outer membrane receptor protein involved in Fe transport